MRSLDQTFGELAEFSVIQGLAYALYKIRVKDGAVFTYHNLSELLEQQLSYRPSTTVIEAALRSDYGRELFDEVSGPGRSPRVEVRKQKVVDIFDRARCRKATLTYRMLKIGEGQFREEMEYLKQTADKEFEFQKTSGIEVTGKADFIGLRFLVVMLGPPDTKRIPMRFADSSLEVDWSKWGAVAAIIAVPVAIIGVILTYMMSK